MQQARGRDLETTSGPMNDYGIPPPGFRLPASTYIGPVRLQVSSLERSIAYYQSVLGLRVQRSAHAEACLGPMDGGRELIWLHARPDARPVPRRGVLGLFHFAILLPDRTQLGSFLAHVQAAGEYVGMADHLVSEALYLTDPDGLGIEVYADRPRSMWQQDDRQLRMTTEALDVQGLLAAAGGRSWSGMPGGTVMGHVHLSVGDLGGAADFYHAGLGFDKTVWDYPGALFMSAGGYHHHLGTNTWSAGRAAADDQARLLSWDVVVPSGAAAEAASRSLTVAGYSVDQDEEAWTALDPWGTRIRIVAGGN